MHQPSLLDYQRQLIIASLDDFTPNDTLANFQGGQYGADVKAWRSAVTDFLCATLVCGLIQATHRREINDKRDVRLLRALLQQENLECDMPIDILWNVLYFHGTPLLVDIMTQCGLRSWDSLVAPESQELFMVLEQVCGDFKWR
ncbi:hypothetical protein AKI39_14665 [Bordetella sp. H567]|uniref:hypothetical protein n=1 Tax=Bordetella sp. H567 TaxID=1697043 RepID=UPI00081C69FD|nr:hypothetical protein [Bordetella sp. H567]AOB31667.1 hypothetical protein AKI39_14665 [Bordetella sp. H567]